jgi:predicted nucleic acid-binding protein
VASLLGGIRTLQIVVLSLAAEDVDGISGILSTYADQGFDLADATIMYLAERERIEAVFTTDRRHFSVYRTRRGKPLSLIPTTT